MSDTTQGTTQTPPPETPETTTETTGQESGTPPKSSSTDEGKTLLTEKADDKAKPEGAPEKYEAYKLPENFTMNEDQTKSANALFKDIGLSQANAQKLVDYYAQMSQKAAQDQLDLYNSTRKGWRDEVAADKELGPNLKQVKVDTSRLLDSIGDPKLAQQFKEAMDLTGAGDHPAFIRAFWAIAKKYSEGTAPPPGGVVTQGQPGASAIPTAAKALYPNLA